MQALRISTGGVRRPRRTRIRCLLAVREHTVRYLLDAFGIKAYPPLDWHVDGVDHESLAFHHDAGKGARVQTVSPVVLGAFPASMPFLHVRKRSGDRLQCRSRSLWLFRIASERTKRCAGSRMASAVPRANSPGTLDRPGRLDRRPPARFAPRPSAETATGFIDVYEAGVRVEVTLPWLLARFAQFHAAQRVIGQKGQLMLEKK